MKKKLFYLSFGIIIVFIICITTKSDNKKTENEKQIKIISYYNNPIIPDGFRKIDIDTAKRKRDNNVIIQDWNKGLHFSKKLVIYFLQI